MSSNKNPSVLCTPHTDLETIEATVHVPLRRFHVDFKSESGVIGTQVRIDNNGVFISFREKDAAGDETKFDLSIVPAEVFIKEFEKFSDRMIKLGYKFRPQGSMNDGKAKDSAGI